MAIAEETRETIDPLALCSMPDLLIIPHVCRLE